MGSRKLMLGNTANGLFWTYRLLERAENMSRLIETGQRIALTRLNSSDKQWLYVMQTAAVSSEYKKYYNKVEKEAALDWMLTVSYTHLTLPTKA